MKIINSKAFFLYLFLIFFQLVFPQKSAQISKIESVQTVSDNVEETTIRAAGYLFVHSSVSLYDSETNEAVQMSPKRCFFIPLKYIKTNLKEAVKLFYTQKKNEVFLPIILTESKQDLLFTNTFLVNNIKEKPIKDEIFDKGSFYKKLKTKFSIKEESGIYQIAYIDGIWDVRTIPHKWVQSIPTGRYTVESLSLETDAYTFYFLNKINVISHDLDIKDVSIELIKN